MKGWGFSVGEMPKLIDRGMQFKEIGFGAPARELEAMLKIDVKTIYSYVQRGLIPYVRIQSKLRYVRAQILDWIEEHNYGPRPPHRNDGKMRLQ